jgi:hypothetical protein
MYRFDTRKIKQATFSSDLFREKDIQYFGFDQQRITGQSTASSLFHPLSSEVSRTLGSESLIPEEGPLPLFFKSNRRANRH